MRQEARFGVAIPSAANLISTETAETLVDLIAHATGETVPNTIEYLGGYLLSREQAEKAIVSEISDINWFSEDMKQRAEATRDPDALDALYRANHALAIAINCDKLNTAVNGQ